jgi:putative IMPACT (imprinted ancient) family translation regulator
MTQLWLSLSEEKTPKDDTPIILRDIIIDRKSRYSVIAVKATSDEEVSLYLKELIKDPYFRKATHNSSAYRIVTAEWSIIESKNDDGETGAGMCILRELQRANVVNTLVIITRYFWGIHLQADRFKNVINATKIVLEKMH